MLNGTSFSFFLVISRDLMRRKEAPYARERLWELSERLTGLHPIDVVGPPAV